MNDTIKQLIPPPQLPGWQPSTCRDLASMGYRRNGLFPLLGEKSRAVEMAFCDFTNLSNGKLLTDAC